MDVKRTKGAVYNLNYHLVWCPKYRRGVLTGSLADRLRQLLDEIAAQSSFDILACEVMPDHVHLFVSAPKYSPSTLAKLFKGVTSRRLRQELSLLLITLGLCVPESPALFSLTLPPHPTCSLAPLPC